MSKFRHRKQRPLNPKIIGIVNTLEYESEFNKEFDIKEYINDEGSSINVLSWKWDEKNIYVRIVNIDTGQRALETTQRTASNVSSDLHRMLNYERGVVPVVDTELVESWLKNLDRDHGIQVFKRRKVDDDAEGVLVNGVDITAVFPRDGMTLYSALSHLTPLETNESVIQARIESRVHQNQAVGDGVRLDALSHAVKSSLLPRPYSVYTSKMSFGVDEANRARQRLIKLIERCFFQNSDGECYASNVWTETLKNRGISEIISKPQTCPARFNVPLLNQILPLDTTPPYILVRTDSEDDLECPDHIKFSSESCVIGKYASLWYDALFFSALHINTLARHPHNLSANTEIKRKSNDYISAYTLTSVDPSCIEMSDQNMPRISESNLRAHMFEMERQIPRDNLHIPQNLTQDHKQAVFDNINAFLGDDSYWEPDDYDDLSKWVLTDEERGEYTSFFNDTTKTAQEIIEFARFGINRNREYDRAKYNQDISKLRVLKTCVEQGEDKALGVIEFTTTKASFKDTLARVETEINELHYGTDRMHTSVAAIWKGSPLFPKLTEIVDRRTVFSLTDHTITKYIKDALLMPVKITVTGPKSNHCSTQCHLQGYFEETSEYNLAMSAARMEFATIKGGAENAERFLIAIRSKEENDSSVQLAATLLKACHRANTRLTSRSATGVTKVERQSLEELKHHAMCSFVLGFGHNQ